MGVAVLGYHAPQSSTITTRSNSSLIYAPSSTPQVYKGSQSGFVSVSFFLVGPAHSVNSWRMCSLSLGNCRGSGPFGLVGDITAFGEVAALFIDGVL